MGMDQSSRNRRAPESAETKNRARSQDPAHQVDVPQAQAGEGEEYPVARPPQVEGHKVQPEAEVDDGGKGQVRPASLVASTRGRRASAFGGGGCCSGEKQGSTLSSATFFSRWNFLSPVQGPRQYGGPSLDVVCSPRLLVRELPLLLPS